MSSRTRREADRRLRDILGQALACVSSDGLISSGPRTSVDPLLRNLSPVRNPTRLITTAGLFLEVRHEYRPVENDAGRWNIHTASYIYTLLDAERRRMLGYHWHPFGRAEETITKPHLHIYAPVEIGGYQLAKLHLHTGPVTLPDIVELLIEEFQVTPRRGNWRAILDRCRAALTET